MNGLERVINGSNVQHLVRSRSFGLCPEGAVGLSLGLTPGLSQCVTPPCLSAVVLGTRDEGGKGRRINYFHARVRLWYPRRPGYRPFRAGRFSCRYLGLKPQAESSRPFGAETKIPLQT